MSNDLLDSLTPAEKNALVAAIKSVSQGAAQKAAEVEAEKFFDATPEFPLTESNLTTLCAFAKQNGLEPNLNGFTTAFNILKDADVFEVAPPTAPPEPEITLAQLDKLSSDDYRRLVNRSEAHAKLVNDLEATRPQQVRRFNAPPQVRGR